MVKEEGQPDSGIMLDVLNIIADKYGYSIKPVSIPKKCVIIHIELAHHEKNGQLQRIISKYQ